MLEVLNETYFVPQSILCLRDNARETSPCTFPTSVNAPLSIIGLLPLESSLVDPVCLLAANEVALTFFFAWKTRFFLS